MPSVQDSIKNRLVSELRKKLNTELSIEKLHFQPFNSLELNGVYLYDQQNNKVLQAEKLYASIALYPLLRNEIIITSVRLNNFEINLSKETSESPLNIQFIIDAFKSDNPSKKPSFELKVNSININEGNFQYDVKDKPYKDNLFDANHIKVSDLDARLSLKSLKTDSLNIQIKKLKLKEKSGFEINNLIVRIITQNKHLYVRGFKLDMPKSQLQLNKCEIDFSRSTSSTDLLDSASIECVITSSYITPKDVSAFTTSLKNFNDRIFLKAQIEGRIDSLKINKLSLDYGDKLHIVANALVKDVRNKEKLYLDGSVDELVVSKDGIEGIINNFSGQKKQLPDLLINLGTVSFKGDISGYLQRLKAYGLLNTQLGAVKADLLFGFNPHQGIESYFDGKISAKDFKLGDLIQNNDLNDLSFDLSIDLQKRVYQPMSGKVKGLIDKFDYKNYTYENITLNGEYNGLKIEGELLVDDENVYLDVNGLFDLSQPQPILNFGARLKNLRLDKLHLSDKYQESYLSLNIDANFTGKSIDDAAGYLSIDSVRFYRNQKSFFLNKFLVEASGFYSDRKLSITSDILNGEVTGTYSFATIAKSIKQTLQPYLPALISVDAKDNKAVKANNLTLNFTVGNTENVSDIFSLPFTTYSEAKIIGFYNNIYEKFSLEVFYPSGIIGGAKIKSGHFFIENSDEAILSNISGVVYGKNNIQNALTIDLKAQNNTIDTKLGFTNDSHQKFGGTFMASTTFSRKENTNQLYTDIEIKPSEVVISDTLWQIKNSHIQIAPEYILVDNFGINNSFRNQSININGKYSKANPADVLRTNLENINLDYIFSALAINALNFGGSATGSLLTSSIDEKPYINIKLDIANFKFNNTLLGNLNLYSELDDETKKVILKGTLIDSEKRSTNIDGSINPLTQELSIHFDADKVNIGFLNKYVSTLFNNVQGRGSGHVHLFGNFSNVTVEGKAFIEDGSLGINFLNTTYNFTDTVFLKKDLIYFNNITFYDQYKNKANISGKVVHDYFSNFMYHVNLTGEKFMLYNGTPKLNPTFFGRVFASGSGSIDGDEQVVNIDARLKTDNNTLIGMNFMEETVDNYSFITYKDSISESLADTIKTKKANTLKTESGIDININLYVNATPEGTVEVIMDPVGGDMIKASGSGALQFIWNANTEPRLYGTYTISKGSYNFTFQKLVERKFILKPGSSVLFRGDPFQANLDVTAIYKLNANLNDLDRGLATLTGQTNVQVESILNITGELRQPSIKLDIALPSTDPEIQRQVKNLLNNEDMINRQMVYLLLLSKFYTPENTDSEYKTTDLASLASATLSTQLSKILSTIDDRWQVGTNIRTSDSQFTNTEIELLLSSRILNDRVILNGNFGYKDNPNTESAFIGDVDVEVLLNPAGTWRLKAYNHYNEKYYYIGNGTNGAPVQTQGIGIIYRKDFDYFRELFGLEPRYKKRLNDSTLTILPDATIKGSKLGDFIKIKND